MTHAQAKRKYDALLNMTAARGCTPHEAKSAARLAKALAKKYGFAAPASQTSWRPNFDERYARAEERAASRFGWEYRKCGKDNCHCARSRSKGHGPYRYAKRREGRTVRSIYMGR